MKVLFRFLTLLLLTVFLPLAARAQLTGCSTGHDANGNLLTYGATTNFDLGLPPAHVISWDTCYRSTLSAIDQLLLNYGTGGGTAQAQTVALSSAITAYDAGLTVRWTPVAANTAAAPTLNVNGLGAKTIVKVGGAALVANDLTTSAIAIAIYDGTNFELQDPQTLSGGSGLADPGSNGIVKRTALNTTGDASRTDIDAVTYAAGGGTAQAQTVTLSPAIAAYSTGLVVRWKPTAANTATAPTLAVNGLAAVAIVKEPGNAALVANDLSASVVAVAVYDGTNFELQDPQTSVGVPVEAVRTTGATLAQSDSNSVIPFNISTAQTVTVPPASNYANVKIASLGTSTATLTVAIPSGTLTTLAGSCPVTSNTIALTAGQQAWVGTDNTNFYAICPPSGTGSGFTVAAAGLYSPSGSTVRRASVADSVLNSAVPFLRDDMVGNPTVLNSAEATSTMGAYGILTVNGTCSTAGTSLIQAPAQSAYFNGWEIVTGATSGNDCGWYWTSGGSVADLLPAPSATQSEIDFVVGLPTVANDYHAVGAENFAGNAKTQSLGSTTYGGYWCDVTDTASAGNWACRFQNFSGGMNTTNITLSPAQTAATSPILIRILYSTSEVDFYFGSTKVGCANSGGTGGCSAWTANSLPTSRVSPAWEAKTNTTLAANTSLYGWSFNQ